MIVQIFKTYWSFLCTAKKEDQFFKWDNILYSVRTMIEPLVLFIFWSAIAAHSANIPSGSIAVYFICFALVARMTTTWVSEDMYNLIHTGELSTRLLQPLPGSVIAWQSLWELNLKRARLSITIPATLLLIFILQYFIPINFAPFSQLLFFPLVIIFTAIIHFCFWLTVAGTTFWIPHNEGITRFIDVIIPFVDGTFIPLIFLNGAMAEWFKILPFRYLFSFPLEILSIPFSRQELVYGIIMMFIWTAITTFITTIVWKKGIKLYQG